MILTCQKCNTRFNLEDSLLKPSGLKVRCSQCKHIFMVYPDRDDVDPEILEDIFEEQQSTLDEKLVQKKSSEPEQKEKEEESEEPPDFSEYEKVLDQSTRPKSSDSPTNETATIQDTTKISSGQTTREKTEQQNDKQVEVPEIAPRVSEKSISPEFIPPPQPPQIRARPSHKLQKKKNKTKLPIILLVVVFLATAGAYIASLFMGYKIPWLSQSKLPIIEKLTSQEEFVSTEPTPTVDQEELSSKFVANLNDGDLFVITGIVKNPPNIAYHHIQVKGTLLTKDQKRVSTKRAFCGTIISDEMLRTEHLSKINALLSNKLGMNGNNSNLAPGALIPFMLVFPELSENMSNFAVEVEGFEKVPVK